MSSAITPPLNSATAKTANIINPSCGVIGFDGRFFFVRDSHRREQLKAILMAVLSPDEAPPTFTTIPSAEEWDKLNPKSPLSNRDWSPPATDNQAADATSQHATAVNNLQPQFQTVTPPQGDNNNRNNNNNQNSINNNNQNNNNNNNQHSHPQGPPSVVRTPLNNNSNNSDASVSTTASTLHPVQSLAASSLSSGISNSGGRISLEDAGTSMDGGKW